MKKAIIYTCIALSVILLIGLVTVNYNTEAQDSQSSKTTSIVAPLLDRSEKIQLGKEWENVQNTYQKNKIRVNSNPDAHKEMLTLAELFIREARVTGEHGHYYPAALKLCNKVMNTTDDPDVKYHALVTKAGVQLSLHEFREALTTAKKAHQINDISARIYGVLVDCYVELGRYNKAVMMADKMVQIKPDIRSYSRVSYVRELHGDYEGAREAMKMAVKAGYPGYEETAWAMLTYGNLSAEMGDWELADKTYDQILATRENYPFAVAAKADLAYHNGDLDKAESLLNKAIDIIPEVHFYTKLAQIYKDQNRVKEFDSIMEEVFLMLEDDVQSGHNMNLEYAHIYLDLMEDYEKANKFAMKEWNKRPENAAVNNLMAKIAFKRDQKQQAKEYLKIVTQLNPENPDLDEMKSLL